MSTSEEFRNLPERDQEDYRDHGHKLVASARDHAIPIIFAPPLSLGGLNPKINGGTGFVLQLPSGLFFAVTASHVLTGYEKRLQEDEVLNWQVGNLLPFDPLDRIAWRSAESDRDKSLPPIEGGDCDCRDIVLLRLLPEEIQRLSPHCIIPAPRQWPPRTPEDGKMVLLGGYPKALRAVDMLGASIGAGPCSAMLPVTTVGEGYFKCQMVLEDLISFDRGTLPDLNDDDSIAGMSGGPALLVADYYPVVGVITEYVGRGFHVFRVSTLNTVDEKDFRPISAGE
jgi:hypothetical protein